MGGVTGCCCTMDNDDDENNKGLDEATLVMVVSDPSIVTGSFVAVVGIVVRDGGRGGSVVVVSIL